jgi:hypothetical protein
MVTLTEIQNCFVEMGEHSKRTTISAAVHKLGLYGRVARQKHLKYSQTVRNKVFWSDETKTGLNAKRHVWRKPGTIPTVKHCGGRIMLWGCFSATGTGRLVRTEGKMNRAKYREILDENLLQSAQTSD